MRDRRAPKKNRIPKERKDLIKQFIARNEISSDQNIEEALNMVTTTKIQVYTRFKMKSIVR